MKTLAFIGGLGGWEVLLVVLIILLLFGAKAIPNFANGIVNGVKEFRKIGNKVKEDLEVPDES